ncbi:MAG: biopolymer transporter ExbD [Proteobacteria bacterium]|nr:biopolymer transporter ExbD [Desulfobulbaceae bacterium]MBU4152903.1 biopolymer transporter ExbD [Pseudomonadota bacterium]
MLNFPARRRRQFAIPLTPLIDIVFLLLIYFLLTSNFVTQQAIDIQLPQVTMETPAIEQLVVVTVDRDGNFYVAGTMVREQDLARHVVAGLIAAAKPEVLIKADREVRYDRVVTAMAIAKHNGATRLYLAIERK